MARLALFLAFVAMNAIIAMAQLGGPNEDYNPSNDDDTYEPNSNEPNPYEVPPINDDYRPVEPYSTPAAPYGYPEDCYTLKCSNQRPYSCKDVKRKDQHYLVVYLQNGYEVLCDTQTGTGGWMVIQRRTNNDINFYRAWGEYKYGFGDYSSNFWFGLEKLYHFTSKGRYELRIDMRYRQSSYHASYSYFRVWGPTEYYKLEVGGYSGDAGDDLRVHNNMSFSTWDRDNDKYSEGNCAEQFRGGWWYNRCHDANPNGEWGSTAFGQGMNWYTLTQYTESLDYIEMKIRPY